MYIQEGYTRETSYLYSQLYKNVRTTFLALNELHHQHEQRRITCTFSNEGMIPHGLPVKMLAILQQLLSFYHPHGSMI